MDRSAVALGIDVAVCIYDRRAQTFENSPHRYEDAAAAHDGRLVEGHDLPVDDDGDVGVENRADRRGGRDRSGRGEAGRTPESLHSYLPPRNDSEGNAYPSAGRVFARLLGCRRAFAAFYCTGTACTRGFISSAIARWSALRSKNPIHVL